ncbi:hypothetical protein AVEN_132880-1 [Araneus ventricosus]|uniref:Uncharacterized protein n=1 Tax=Araneus ventricosus TaxID=182803 RepID=A0A4Y2RPP2_ARAVE|nr:hypothetical protein AVEN_132880-1 [Araneus ventricosus]
METDISVKVLTTTSVDPWLSCEMQTAQLEDLAIKPILEKKLNSVDRPSSQKSLRRVLQRNDTGLFGTPYILRTVFYIVGGRMIMEAPVRMIMEAPVDGN